MISPHSITYNMKHGVNTPVILTVPEHAGVLYFKQIQSRFPNAPLITKSAESVWETALQNIY